jgi:hypothetical protein
MIIGFQVLGSSRSATTMINVNLGLGGRFIPLDDYSTKV